jgi:hypothetical protein
MAKGRSIKPVDDFTDWLGSLPHWHRVAIAGDHDMLFQSNRKTGTQTSRPSSPVQQVI